jgi:hypothetical protein
VSGELTRRTAIEAVLAAAFPVPNLAHAQGGAEASRAAPKGVPQFVTLAELLEARPSREFSVVGVLGVGIPGEGAALYRRVGREPFHPGKVRSADGAWWEIVPGDCVNVLQFGAIGDGASDDGKAIQAAIDYAIFAEGGPKRVFLPARRYLVGDTLHVGYGDRFVTLELLGEPGLASADERPLGLYPTFNDRPCLNVQGGKRVRLRGLSLFGVNRDYLRGRYDQLEDRGRRADWMGPALTPGSNDRHAPYAGIVIDGYAGPPPPRRYPAVVYPSFLGVQTQYGKNFSGDIILEDCRVEGFCVGVAVQPGVVPDASNGDFITYRDCSLNFNVVGIADGHADSRCNNIVNSRLHFCHTAIDSVGYGPGAGTFIAAISGSSFDNNWRILNINAGGAKSQGPFPLKFEGCYGESLYHIGVVGSPGGRAPGVSFEACKFEFSIKNKEFSPPALLVCKAGAALFRNCVLQGGFGLAHFDAAVELEGVGFSHLQSGGLFDFRTAAGRLAQSFTCGAWAREARTVRLQPIEFFDFSGRSIDFAHLEGFDSRAFAFGKDAAPDSRGRPIPWWVENLADDRALFRASQVPAIALNRSVHPVAISAIRGAEYDLDLPRTFIARLEASGVEAKFAFGAGDIVEDQEGGMLAYVTKAAFPPDLDPVGARLTVRQLTSARTRDFGRSWEIAAPMASDSGLLVFHNARRFYPCSRQAFLESEKGETTARLAPRRGLAEEGQAALWPEVGDYLASTSFGPFVEPCTSLSARVTAVDRAGGAIRLSQAAARNDWGECTSFIKAG